MAKPQTLDDLTSDQPTAEPQPQRSKVGRPRSESPKRMVTLRLDVDLLDRLKAEGAGWQTRINEALRKAAGI